MKRRISIARVILKNAPVVILDEATASIALENEQLIPQAISETRVFDDTASLGAISFFDLLTCMVLSAKIDAS